MTVENEQVIYKKVMKIKESFHGNIRKVELKSFDAKWKFDITLESFLW